MAAARTQPLELACALDAFRRHGEIEAARKRQDRFRDRGVARGAVDVTHEGLVDLDAVGREVREVGERGIAGAEVVQRDPAAELAEASEDVLHRLRIVHQQRFGDLDLDKRSRHARRRGFRFDQAGRIAVQQLLAGAVDGHRHSPAAIQPYPQLAAGSAHHPLAHVDDQAAVLGDLHEAGRRNLAEFLVAPAQQRFHADQPVVAESELGLEHQREQVVVHGVAQPCLQLQPVAQAPAHGGSVEGDRPGGAGLRLVHRGIRVLEHRRHIAAVVRVDGDPDARRRVELE